MNKYVASDLMRYSGKVTARAFVKTYLKSRSFRWQVAFRLVNGKGIEKIFFGGGAMATSEPLGVQDWS